MKSEHFDCSCHSDEHTIVFRFFDDKVDDLKELYLSVYLNQYRNVFKRIWIAIKYVFGYKCKYGHWDCWTMVEDDCKRLKTILEKFEESETSGF